MKKIIFILTLFLSFAFIGCGDDGTNLRWDNNSGTDVKDIQWYKYGGVGSPDQTWSGTLGDDTSGYKEITELKGTVAALAWDGYSFETADITLADGENARAAGKDGGIIEKDTYATLEIYDATAKKK